MAYWLHCTPRTYTRVTRKYTIMSYVQIQGIPSRPVIITSPWERLANRLERSIELKAWSAGVTDGWCCRLTIIKQQNINVQVMYVAREKQSRTWRLRSNNAAREIFAGSVVPAQIWKMSNKRPMLTNHRTTTGICHKIKNNNNNKNPKTNKGNHSLKIKRGWDGWVQIQN